jgi:hypothetical protein
MIKKFDFYRRLFVVFMAVLQPFILLWVCGDLNSLSDSWNTQLQPLFIITNACVSYFFFDLERWKVPSVLLLMLTAFSVTSYPIAHNILAVTFFITCFFPLFFSKRFKYYSLIYLLSIVIGIFYGLFWLETYSIIVLCVYHLHNMIYKQIITNRRK